MALDRKYQKVFGGSLTPTGNISVYGTKKEGNVSYSDNLDVIQSNNWLLGMIGGTSQDKAPYLQDLNGIFYTITKQLAYIFQAGISEWNSQTEYIANRSVVLRNGKTYIAIANSTNVEPEVTSGWGSSWKSLTEWGFLTGSITKQTDLWNILLKGLSYDSSITYSQGDRVLVAKDGYRFFVESLVDNNTNDTSDSHVWYIKNLRFIEGAATSSSLPTPSETNEGLIYFNSDSPTGQSYYICERSSNSFVWTSKLARDIFTSDDTIYRKDTQEYYGRVNVTQYNGIGIIGGTWLSGYTWLCKEPIFANHPTGLPSTKFVSLSLGASESEYIAPADGWFYISASIQSSSQYGYVIFRVDKNSINVYTKESYATKPQVIQDIFPVKKGVTVKITYGGIDSVNRFQFVYA